MKKYLTIILFTLLLFTPSIIDASYEAIVKTSSTVNMRKGAGTSYSTLYSLGNGTAITLENKTLYTGSGCSAGWYKIQYKDKTGYMCSTYVKVINVAYEGINTIDYTARITSNNTNVRKGPSTSYAVIESLSLGANVTILGETNGWYKVKYYGDSVGYVDKDFIKKKTEVTASDPEYEANELKDFPESYKPYLSYLHKLHPNWVFVPKNTKLKFETVVNAEEGKCYMQTTNNNYRTSTKPAEGSSWFKVNIGVIAFYMDPRNWLTEDRVFMFEQLGYSPELEENYLPMVKAVFGSGKLSDDKYTIPMVNAGKLNGISPVHIASRISLEVGNNGSDSTNGGEFTFKGQTYSGYYNFFNIGAYEETIDGVKYNSVQRGLAVAAKLIPRDGIVWDSIEASISEGSRFLANGYVNKGQGTLYYQKFNVSPDAYYSKYSHQYQTNIQAPATEGNKARNAYKSKKQLNNNFVFEIPVYTNMPNATSLPKSGDTDNELKSLVVKDYSLTPAFDKDVKDYEVFVPKTLTKVSIEANPNSTLATIDYLKEVELKDNETIVTISVTSEAGIENKYTLTIKKVEDSTKVDNVIINSNLTLNNTIITNIKNSTTASTLKNNLIKSGATNVIIKNGNTTINDTNILATGMTVTIVTSLENKTYTLAIKGDTSGDGKITILDLLQVQKHILGTKKLTNANLLACDTSGDGKVTILDLLQIQKHILGTKKL